MVHLYPRTTGPAPLFTRAKKGYDPVMGFALFVGLGSLVGVIVLCAHIIRLSPES